jgi:hypothetical protein
MSFAGVLRTHISFGETTEDDEDLLCAIPKGKTPDHGKQAGPTLNSP